MGSESVPTESLPELAHRRVPIDGEKARISALIRRRRGGPSRLAFECRHPEAGTLFARRRSLDRTLPDPAAQPCPPAARASAARDILGRCYVTRGEPAPAAANPGRLESPFAWGMTIA